MSERGIIKNQSNMLTVEFSGIRYGNITPTDIDSMMEFDDKAFVFIEVKHKNAPLPVGQSIMLTRLCNNLEKAGKHCVVFVASWDKPTPRNTIKLSDYIVTKIYLSKFKNNKFKDCNDGVRLDLYIDRFLIHHKLIADVLPQQSEAKE